MSIQNLFGSNNFTLKCNSLECDNCTMNTQNCLGQIKCDSLLVGDTPESVGSIQCKSLDCSGNVIFSGLPEAYADKLVFYNSTTGSLSYNKGYFSQTTNTTFVSEYYGFELNAQVTVNIVGNMYSVFIKFDPYTYFQNVADTQSWVTNNNPLPVGPVNGAIYQSAMINGSTIGYQQILIRCFDNGNIALSQLPGVLWATHDTETLNVYSTGFSYINPDV